MKAFVIRVERYYGHKINSLISTSFDHFYLLTLTDQVCNRMLCIDVCKPNLLFDMYFWANCGVRPIYECQILDFFWPLRRGVDLCVDRLICEYIQEVSAVIFCLFFLYCSDLFIYLIYFLFTFFVQLAMLCYAYITHWSVFFAQWHNSV